MLCDQFALDLDRPQSVAVTRNEGPLVTDLLDKLLRSFYTLAKLSIKTDVFEFGQEKTDDPKATRPLIKLCISWQSIFHWLCLIYDMDVFAMQKNCNKYDELKLKKCREGFNLFSAALSAIIKVFSNWSDYYAGARSIVRDRLLFEFSARLWAQQGDVSSCMWDVALFPHPSRTLSLCICEMDMINRRFCGKQCCGHLRTTDENEILEEAVGQYRVQYMCNLFEDGLDALARLVVSRFESAILSKNDKSIVIQLRLIAFLCSLPDTDAHAHPALANTDTHAALVRARLVAVLCKGVEYIHQRVLSKDFDDLLHSKLSEEWGCMAFTRRSEGLLNLDIVHWPMMVICIVRLMGHRSFGTKNPVIVIEALQNGLLRVLRSTLVPRFIPRVLEVIGDVFPLYLTDYSIVEATQHAFKNLEEADFPLFTATTTMDSSLSSGPTPPGAATMDLDACWRNFESLVFKKVFLKQICDTRHERHEGRGRLSGHTCANVR